MTQAAAREVHADTLWNSRFAQRTQRVASSVIRELLKLTERPGVISFAGGLPAPDMFPVADIQAAACRVLGAGGVTRTLRLNFSYCSPERIEEGIARLGAVLRGRLGNSLARASAGEYSGTHPQ